MARAWMLLFVLLHAHGGAEEPDWGVEHWGRTEAVEPRSTDLSARPLGERGALELLQRDAGAASSVAAGFKVGGPQLGEAAPGADDQELKDLEDEVAALKAKVRAAEKGVSTELAFQEQQASMQDRMLAQKLDARLKQKHLQLDQEVSRTKREMGHQLQQQDIQARAEEQSEGSQLSNMQLAVQQEASKADRMAQAAAEQESQAAKQIGAEEEHLAKMRAKAEAIESEVQDLKLGNLGLRSEAQATNNKVAHASKQAALADASTKQEQQKAAQLREAATKQQAELQHQLAQESSIRAESVKESAQSAALAKELAKENARASGVRAEQQLVDAMSQELMAANAAISKDKYAAASQKLAVEGKLKATERELEEFEDRKARVAQEREAVLAQTKQALEQSEQSAQHDQDELKKDLEGEAAELSREMLKEDMASRSEQQELMRQINATQEETLRERVAGKQEVEHKRQMDRNKIRQALNEVASTGPKTLELRIKARYRSAMRNVKVLKLEDQAVEADAQRQIGEIQNQTRLEISRVEIASEQAINASRRKAETLVGDATKLMTLEEQEIRAERLKMAAAGTEASAREKSSIQRALAGEHDAIQDAVSESVRFAHAQAKEYARTQELVLSDLGRLIMGAGTAKKSEETLQSTLDAKLKVTQSKRSTVEAAVAKATQGFEDLKTQFQQVRSELGTTAIEARKHVADVAKRQAEVDQFTNANTVLDAQIKQADDAAAKTAGQLSQKLRLKEALSQQLKLVEAQLAAANKTEISLGKVRQVKQDAADNEAKDQEIDATVTQQAVDALQNKAANLQAKSDQDAGKQVKPVEAVSWTDFVTR
eukprot:TRINITY_DN10990_c0_g1_i2.p1 TRINITY_DN10990_c0_g1~~TRINITY_DN10990_c0_g1_i2.p1  ORF type:complete len:832 (-),score=327.15 TRINITY_DN10990_c0_g1_i2:212-2707(-)